MRPGRARVEAQKETLRLLGATALSLVALGILIWALAVEFSNVNMVAIGCAATCVAWWIQAGRMVDAVRKMNEDEEGR